MQFHRRFIRFLSSTKTRPFSMISQNLIPEPATRQAHPARPHSGDQSEGSCGARDCLLQSRRPKFHHDNQSVTCHSVKVRSDVKYLELPTPSRTTKLAFAWLKAVCQH